MNFRLLLLLVFICINLEESTAILNHLLKLRFKSIFQGFTTREGTVPYFGFDAMLGDVHIQPYHVRHRSPADQSSLLTTESEEAMPTGQQHSTSQKPPPHHVSQTLKTDDEIFMKLFRDVVSEGNPHEIYEIDNEDCSILGRGSTGLVQPAIRKTDSAVVAIKSMILTEATSKFYHNEILMMKQNEHPNIVNYIESYLNEGRVWIVMEYINGVSLFNIVRKRQMDEKQIATVCHEVLKGLEYLHNKGVIHRDIKCANTMLGLNGSVKLIDFGHAFLLTTSNQPRLRTAIENRRYRTLYGARSDLRERIWEKGIMAIEMLDGNLPYFKLTPAAVYYYLRKDNKPKLDDLTGKITEKFQNFLDRCLKVIVSERGTVDDLLNDPFLQNPEPTSTLTDLIKEAKNMEFPKVPDTSSDKHDSSITL